MTGDPKRWLDDAADAPEGARELLAHGRRTAAPDKSAIAMSAAALIKLGVQPASAAAAVMTKLAAAPSALVGLPMVAKVVVAVTTVAVVALVGVSALPRHSGARGEGSTSSLTTAAPIRVQSAPAPRVASVVAPLVAPIVSPSETTEPKPTLIEPAAPNSAPSVASVNANAAVTAEPSSPRRARRSQPRALRAAPTITAPLAATATQSPPVQQAPEDPLALEVSWLDQARSSLASDPTAALARANAHAEHFSAPALGAERELIAIDALQRLGRTQEAHARANALLRSRSGSLYRTRVQQLLSAARR